MDGYDGLAGTAAPDLMRAPLAEHLAPEPTQEGLEVSNLHGSLQPSPLDGQAPSAIDAVDCAGVSIAAALLHGTTKQTVASLSGNVGDVPGGQAAGPLRAMMM